MYIHEVAVSEALECRQQDRAAATNSEKIKVDEQQKGLYKHSHLKCRQLEVKPFGLSSRIGDMEIFLGECLDYWLLTFCKQNWRYGMKPMLNWKCVLISKHLHLLFGWRLGNLQQLLTFWSKTKFKTLIVSVAKSKNDHCTPTISTGSPLLTRFSNNTVF